MVPYRRQPKNPWVIISSMRTICFAWVSLPMIRMRRRIRKSKTTWDPPAALWPNSNRIRTSLISALPPIQVWTVKCRSITLKRQLANPKHRSVCWLSMRKTMYSPKICFEIKKTRRHKPKDKKYQTVRQRSQSLLTCLQSKTKKRDMRIWKSTLQTEIRW